MTHPDFLTAIATGNLIESDSALDDIGLPLFSRCLCIYCSKIWNHYDSNGIHNTSTKKHYHDFL
jgi:hypothetical protein